jgi:hypothetical protein
MPTGLPCSFFTGLPHYTHVNDSYNGYLIPGESLVLANLWLVLLYLLCANSQCIGRSMTRDEEIYPDAEAFKPERFIKNGALNKEIRDPREFVFGFGRR